MISRTQRNLARIAVSPELELLLLCARPVVDTPAAERIRSVCAQRIEWDRLLRLSEAHGLAPLLFRHLAESSAVGVPPSVLGNLRLQFERTTLRNLALLRELFAIVAMLRDHGIDAVPYKGPVLSMLLYGHPGLRRCRDIDLLVRPENVACVIELLRQRSYCPVGGQPAHVDVAHGCELEVVRSDGTIVDVNWNVAPSYMALRHDVDELWDTLQTVTLQGTAVRCIRADLLLPVLCIHGTKHGWERLAWVADIAALTAAVSNWEAIVEASHRARSRRMLLLGLELARTLLEARLPAAVQAAIRGDKSIARLTRAVRQRIERTPGPRAFGLLEEHRFVLTARERMTDRLRYVWRLASRPSQRDRDFIALPHCLRHIYVAVKPIRLAVKLAASN